MYQYRQRALWHSPFGQTGAENDGDRQCEMCISELFPYVKGLEFKNEDFWGRIFSQSPFVFLFFLSPAEAGRTKLPHTALGSWDHAPIPREVMSITQWLHVSGDMLVSLQNIFSLEDKTKSLLGGGGGWSCWPQGLCPTWCNAFKQNLLPAPTWHLTVNPTEASPAHPRIAQHQTLPDYRAPGHNEGLHFCSCRSPLTSNMTKEKTCWAVLSLPSSLHFSPSWAVLLLVHPGVTFGTDAI